MKEEVRKEDAENDDGEVELEEEGGEVETARSESGASDGEAEEQVSGLVQHRIPPLSCCAQIQNFTQSFERGRG